MSNVMMEIYIQLMDVVQTVKWKHVEMELLII
jgi:hypothetical protein